MNASFAGLERTHLPGLQVGKCDAGRGVFVLDPVAAGDLVLRLEGRMIDFLATVASDREGDALQIGLDRYLELTEPGRLINHSCEPNTGVRHCVDLVALRDLSPGEEVRFDYSTTMGDDHWTMECRCGTPSCRGTVRDFRSLPHERKLALIAMHVVPAFLVAEEILEGRLDTDEIRSARGSFTDRRPKAIA